MKEIKKDDATKAGTTLSVVGHLKHVGKVSRDVGSTLKKIPLSEAKYTLTKQDRFFSHFSSAAYHKNPTPIYGYHLDKNLSTVESQVWVNKHGKVVVSFRGTTNAKDLKTDAKIVARSRSDARFTDAKKLTEKVINRYGKGNVNITGHSLGGTIGRYVSSELGISQGAVFNPGASPSEYGKHVDKTKLKTIINHLDPVSHSLIGGENVHVTKPPKDAAHSHSIESAHDKNGNLKSNLKSLKSPVLKIPEKAGLIKRPSIVNAFENTNFGQNKPTSNPGKWAQIQKTSAEIAGKSSLIVSKAGSSAATLIRIAGAAAAMVGGALLIVDAVYETLHFIYNVVDFNAQKKEEADKDNWAQHFNFLVKVDKFITYTWSTRKTEKASTALSPFTPLETVKSWWGPIQPGDHPDERQEDRNRPDTTAATKVFRDYKGQRIPPVKLLDTLRKEPNNLHYVFMTPGKYEAEKSKNPSLAKYIHVQHTPETYNYFAGIYTAFYDKEDLYYIPPEAVEDTGGKVLRYVEIPTILMNSEAESVYKFRFFRIPKDTFTAGVYNGGYFEYEETELISGQVGLKNYYEWLAFPANQESYGIYTLWKTDYPNITFENIKQAFSNSNNYPSLEELKKMNEQKIDRASAQAQVDKENSPETLQLKQTTEVLDAEKVKLYNFLEQNASDPQSVYTFLYNDGLAFGGWTDASWQILWDYYNLWRASKGLAPVERNSDGKSTDQTSIASNGALLSPYNSSLSGLFQGQNKAYEKEWRIIL